LEEVPTEIKTAKIYKRLKTFAPQKNNIRIGRKEKDKRMELAN
jgi:hypothetical protein